MARKSTAEDRLFDLLEDNFKTLSKNQYRMERKLEDNTKKTEKGFNDLNIRVKKLEDDNKAKKKSDLSPWYRDPVFVKTIGGTLIITVAGIIAAALGFKLPL